MTRAKRKKQLKDRIIITILIIIFCIASIITIANTKYTYAITAKTETGLHYRYVTEYSLKATYIGSGIFLDTTGNEWEVSNIEYEKGKQYRLILHDNGTEKIEDDVIVKIS